MERVIWFLIIFIATYLAYLLFIICRTKKLEKFKNSSEVQLLVKKFKLDLNKIKIKSLAHIVGLSNAFIISVTFIVSDLVDNFILKLMVIFVTLIILIMVIYSIVGKILKKKEGI